MINIKITTSVLLQWLWTCCPIVVLQQVQFACLVPARFVASRKSAGIFPSIFNRQCTATTSELVSCVQLSEMDALCSVNTQSNRLFQIVWSLFQTCLLEQSGSLHPWGAPNVTNPERTEKYINTTKTTWTQLVAALTKNVYPATKPIVWGLNKPAVFLFKFIVWASMCVSGFVCCMMPCSDKMTFCTNSENFPQGDGNNTHADIQKDPIHAHAHTHTNTNVEPDFGQVWLRGNEILFLLTQTIVFLLTPWLRLSQQSPWDAACR